jgi:hypothetical protein
MLMSVFLVLASMPACSSISSFIGFRKSEVDVPVVRVLKKPVEVKIHTLGELRPARMATIVAPPVAGGALQIVHLARTGTYVKQNDVVVEFDPSEQEYNLEQSKSQLEEAEQQIKKMKADQAVRVAKEQVSLLQAQYEVKRAELKVKGNDLLSGIEARKNVISLEESKRKLEQFAARHQVPGEFGCGGSRRAERGPHQSDDGDETRATVYRQHDLPRAYQRHRHSGPEHRSLGLRERQHLDLVGDGNTRIQARRAGVSRPPYCQYPGSGPYGDSGKGDRNGPRQHRSRAGN